MSIHTITIDEFMRLTPHEHHIALELYDAAIGTCQDVLDQKLTNPLSDDVRGQLTEKLASYRTLRQIHADRIEELESDGFTNNVPADAVH